MMLLPQQRGMTFAPPSDGVDAGGLQVRGVTCTSVDVLALELWRQQSVITAFETLLRSLVTDLHITLQVRRAHAADIGADTDDGDDALATAMTTHWRRRCDERALHRRLLRISSSGPVDPVARQMDAVIATLDALGIGWSSDTREKAPVSVDREAVWVESRAHLRVGELWVRAMELHRLPGAAVDAGWLAPLLRIEAECDVALHLAPVDTAGAVRRLSRRMRDLGAHRMLEADRGLVPDADVAVGMDAAARLRERLSSHAAHPLTMSIEALARGASAEEMARHARLLQSALASTLAAMRPAHLGHRAAAARVWGWSNERAHGKLVDSQTAATCVPWLDAEADDGHGYRLGAIERSGLPVRLDPFDETRHANANIGIFGASGQGKSFLVGGLIIEAQRGGAEILVVDPEGEYRALVTRLGGRFADLTELSINPFELADARADRCSAVVDVCGELCGGLSDLERAQADAAAGRACDEIPAPQLRDCMERLDPASRIATILGRFLDGPLATLLDRPTSPLWQEPLLAIGHQEMRDELVPVTTHLLGLQLWRLVRGHPRRRHVILDEVGTLAAHPPMRRLLALLARRCRKYGSGLVVATQNVQDLLRSDEGQVVAGNCAITFCGGHRSHEAQLMERCFGLTEEQRRSVERAPRGGFVLLAGQRRTSMRVDLPPEYAALIRGDSRKPAQG